MTGIPALRSHFRRAVEMISLYFVILVAVSGAPVGVEYQASVNAYVWVEALPQDPSQSVSLTAKSEIIWHLSGPTFNLTDLNLAGSNSNGWVRNNQVEHLPISTNQPVQYHSIQQTNVQKYRFHVRVSEDFSVYFYDYARGCYYEAFAYEGTATELLFIVKRKGEGGGSAGKATEIMPGETNMRISLGNLSNGQSAGFLDYSPMIHLGGRSGFENVFLLGTAGTPGFGPGFWRLDLPGRAIGPFQCNPTSDLVKVIYAPAETAGRKYIRQVLSPQALFVVDRQNNGAYTKVSVYNSTGVTGSLETGYVPAENSQPYVSYEFLVGGDYYSYGYTVIKTEGGKETTATYTRTRDPEDQFYYTTTVGEQYCAEEEEFCVWWQQDCTRVTAVAPDGTKTVEINCGDYICQATTIECIRWEIQDVPEVVPYYARRPRNEVEINGLSVNRREESVSFDSRWDHPSSTWDSYHVMRTDSSATVVVKHGGGRDSVNMGSDHAYQTVESAGCFETSYELKGPLPAGPVSLAGIDGTNSYISRRKYESVLAPSSLVASTHPADLQYEERADGSWVMYDRYRDQEQYGLVSRIIKPEGNTARPESFPENGTAGFRIQAVEYTHDWAGSKRLPSKVTTWAGVTKLSETIFSYSSETRDGQPIWVVTTTQTALATGISTTSRFKSFEGIGVDPMLSGLPYSIEESGGLKKCYYYERGTVADGVFSPSTTGRAMRITEAIGYASGSVTEIEEHSIDSIGLISNASHRTSVVYDERGLRVRAERRAYAESQWHLLDWQQSIYDFAGNLIKTDSNIGPIYEAEYTNKNGASTSYSGITFANDGDYTGRLEYAKNAHGVIEKYLYDDHSRVEEEVRLGIPATTDTKAVPELRTAFTYNADGRVLKKTLGETPGEQVKSSYVYDFSGRLVEVEEQGLKTSYEYPIVGGVIQSTKQIRPDGTYIQTFGRRDGRVEKIVGDAVVPRYYHYTASNGAQICVERVGEEVDPEALDAGRWSKTWTDGFGRVFKKQHSKPSSVVGDTTTTYTYNNVGQLKELRSSGLAATFIEYDAMGRPMREVLDLDGNNQVSAGDRRGEVIRQFRKRGADWWQYKAETTFAPGEVNGLTTKESWTRESGFSTVALPTSSYITPTGRILSEAITRDPNGNETHAYVVVDRSNATQTNVVFTPLASEPSVGKSVLGVTVKSASSAGVIKQVEIDRFLRPLRAYDRTRTTYEGVNFTYVTGTSRIESTYDNGGRLMSKLTYDDAGRVRKSENPKITYSAVGSPSTYSSTELTKTFFHYNKRGQLTHQWGDTLSPVKYVYDNFGQRLEQYTYRTFPVWSEASVALGDEPSFWPSGGDVTRWEYALETGLVTERKNPIPGSTSGAYHVTKFAYNARGQLTKTTSPRPGVFVDYQYDEGNGGTGNLLAVSYSGGAPTVAYNFDGLGRPSTIQDATGSRTLKYRTQDARLLEEDFGDDSVYGGDLKAVRTYGNLNSAVAAPTGLQIVSRDGIDHSLQLALDSAGGRLNKITTAGAEYLLSYLADSDLVESITSGAWSKTIAYETDRNLVRSVQTTTGGTSIANYSLSLDALGRRYRVDQGGLVYAAYVTAAQAVINEFAYNVRSELTGSRTSIRVPSDLGTGQALPGRTAGYEYDEMGNRKRLAVDGEWYDYTINSLNQYTSRNTQPTIAVAGTAAEGTTVKVNDEVVTSSQWTNRYFMRPVNKAPASGGRQSFAISGTRLGQVSATQVSTWVSPNLEDYTYDEAGNLTRDGLWEYAYDAENRLVGMYSHYPDDTGSRVAVLYDYDYQSRRAIKRVYDYVGGALGAARSRRLYMYDGQNLIAEYDADPDTRQRLALVRTYTWGPDLTGGVSAGGMGGLLAIRDHRPEFAGIYNTAFDANGNLVALVMRGSGELAAAYEYDNFGSVIRSSGRYASENPIRFATKYQDAETGLIYYGMRYYDPGLGRFINQDPIRESGGVNIYGFAGNDPIGSWDYLGLQSSQATSSSAPSEVIRMETFYVHGRYDKDGKYMPWRKDDVIIARGKIYRVLTDELDGHFFATRMTIDPEKPHTVVTDHHVQVDIDAMYAANVKESMEQVVEDLTDPMKISFWDTAAHVATAVAVGAVCTVVIAGTGPVGFAIIMGFGMGGFARTVVDMERNPQNYTQQDIVNTSIDGALIAIGTAKTVVGTPGSGSTPKPTKPNVPVERYVPGNRNADAPHHGGEFIGVPERVPVLFHNKLPLQDPVNARPLVVVDGKFKIRMPDGSLRTPTGEMNFVTMPDGRILVHRSGGHTGISHGRPVLYAGQVRFTKSGELKGWTNGSGHYTPTAANAWQAGFSEAKFVPHDQ